MSIQRVTVCLDKIDYHRAVVEGLRNNEHVDAVLERALSIGLDATLPTIEPQTSLDQEIRRPNGRVVSITQGLRSA